MAREVVALRLGPELRDALDVAARDRGLSRGALARMAVMKVCDPELPRAEPCFPVARPLRGFDGVTRRRRSGSFRVLAPATACAIPGSGVRAGATAVRGARPCRGAGRRSRPERSRAARRRP